MLLIFSITCSAYTRPLGMGGAFVAVADDVNAIMYNPAGLAFIDSPQALIYERVNPPNGYGTKVYQYSVSACAPLSIGTVGLQMYCYDSMLGTG
jgi:hypothetical protein